MGRRKGIEGGGKKALTSSKKSWAGKTGWGDVNISGGFGVVGRGWGGKPVRRGRGKGEQVEENGFKSKTGKQFKKKKKTGT